MNFLGVSKIKKDATTGEVTSCLLHAIEIAESDFHVRAGVKKSVKDVVKKIAKGDHIYVLTRDGDIFKVGELVCFKNEETQYLYSAPNNSFLNLPNI
ncbi:MAG: hypothetical protein HY306_08815 [Nitrosomonadales bacterium]|nr:hypothetical protein [Nitrosomonadales bacterium]